MDGLTGCIEANAANLPAWEYPSCSSCRRFALVAGTSRAAMIQSNHFTSSIDTGVNPSIFSPRSSFAAFSIAVAPMRAGNCAMVAAIVPF